MILKSLLLLLIVGELKITRAEEGCGPPPPVEHTIPIEQTKFPVDHTLRYKCEPGFKRKAGTSNQIKCKFNSTSLAYGWHTTLRLICVATSTKKTTTATPEYTTSTGTPLPTVGQTTTHVTTSGKPHTTHTSLAPKAIARTTARATRTSVTFPGTTTTTTTATTTTTTTTEAAAWETREATGAHVKPTSTGSSVQMPTRAFPSPILDSSVFVPHSNQPAVVSGSVLAVVAFILLTGLLCFLRSKKALPFRQRYNIAGTAAASERVDMATQPNTPSSCTPLCEEVVSDADGPPS
ncbi:interleukin-15 receptor subunit alpha isoform X1 [Alosa pseudoharengus]|uniref:interleukin-15 receptor subunit alpha isoform X1 n=1 Tax=Alosa pseudoharengus TaxID=34774 RepID=UPI003F88C901